jgi:hypothetical protein
LRNSHQLSYLYFELGLFDSTWWFPVPPILCNWHNLIFLYGWVIFHSIHICHIFLIHLLVVGNFGGFQSLAIVNTAAINMGMHVSLVYWFTLLEYMPKSGMVVHKVSLFLYFWGTSILVSIAVAPLYIPFKCIRVPFLTSICCLFSWWLPIWVQWDGILVSFDFNFLHS